MSSRFLAITAGAIASIAMLSGGINAASASPREGSPSDTRTQIAVGGAPVAMATDPGVGFVYVACRNAGVDILHGTSLVGHIDVPDPISIATDSSSHELYVATFRDTRTSDIVEYHRSATGWQEGKQYVVPAVLGLAIDPIHHVVYASTKTELDIVDDGALKTVPGIIPSGPIAFDPLSGRAYVADSQGNNIDEFSGIRAVGSIQVNSVTSIISNPWIADLPKVRGAGVFIVAAGLLWGGFDDAVIPLNYFGDSTTTAEITVDPTLGDMYGVEPGGEVFSLRLVDTFSQFPKQIAHEPGASLILFDPASRNILLAHPESDSITAFYPTR